MAKIKTSFFCQNCGAQYSKWQGQCTSCKEWNTIVEEIVQTEKHPAWSGKKQKSKALKIADIRAEEELRIETKNTELDRVLGGGVVPGAVILLGGEPGIGKSTLMLQLAF